MNYAKFLIYIVISNLKFAIAMFYIDFTMRYSTPRCVLQTTIMTYSFTNLICAIATNEIKGTRCNKKTSSIRNSYYYWHVISEFNTNDCCILKLDHTIVIFLNKIFIY